MSTNTKSKKQEQSVPPAPEPPTPTHMVELKPEEGGGVGPAGSPTPKLPAYEAKKSTSITVWCTEEEKARWTAHVGPGKLSERVRDLLNKESARPRTTPWAWEQNGLIKPEAKSADSAS